MNHTQYIHKTQSKFVVNRNTQNVFSECHRIVLIQNGVVVGWMAVDFEPSSICNFKKDFQWNPHLAPVLVTDLSAVRNSWGFWGG